MPNPAAYPEVWISRGSSSGSPPRATVGAPPAANAAARDARPQPGGQPQPDQPDRHVDVEHPAPAVRAGERGQDQAADHRSGRGGQPDGGAEDAERLATLGAAEQVLDEPGILRGEHAARDALQQAGADQQPNGRRGAKKGWSPRTPAGANRNTRRRPRVSPSRPAGTRASPKASA